MRTRRRISNISYNTVDFFENIIKELYNSHNIEWCYWILHKADTDDTKNHIHFVLQPSGSIDTFQLHDLFIQPVDYNVKPLCVTSKWFFTNSLDDWLLYVIHYKPYLLSKGLTRNIFYDFNDIKSTDEDALKYDINAIDTTKYNRLNIIKDAVNNKIPFATLVQNGQIPINLRTQYQFQYKELQKLKYAENRKKGFIQIDKETAEIIGFTD